MTQTEYEPNSFERFILHNRIYCEHEGCRFKLTPAIRVRSLYKNPVAVCQFHADLGEKETQSRGHRSRTDGTK